MKHLITAVIITAVSAGSIGFTTTALADDNRKGEHHEMHEKYHGKDGHGSTCWRNTLSDDQSKQVDQLKVDYKKKVYPVKAKIKQAKIDLALLIGSDKPKQKDIDKKIDEILKLKGEKMRLKSSYQVEVRKVLTAEQRANFDMKLLKKANRDKKGYKHGKGHH